MAKTDDPTPEPEPTKPVESFKAISPITLGDTVKPSGSTVTVDELNQHNLNIGALVAAGALKGAPNA